MVAPVVAAAYIVIAFLLRVLLYVLKKLLNQAAKVTTDIVKKHLELSPICPPVST